MFDIHSHILPGLDDGARSMEESLQLLRRAAEQGESSVIATPHYSVERPTDPGAVCAKLAELRQAVVQDEARRGEKQTVFPPDFQLFSGNEVLYFDSIVEHLLQRRILTLMGSHFVLIEFYPRESYAAMLRAVRKLRYAGYYPVIAHAERFSALYETGNGKGLEGLRVSGAYIQLSTAPVGGFFLRRETRFIEEALRSGQAQFLGTDMHRIDTRPPELGRAVRWIRKHCGNAEALLTENAERMKRDEDFL